MSKCQVLVEGLGSTEGWGVRMGTGESPEASESRGRRSLVIM